MTHTNYLACNALGKVVYTAGDKDIGKRWVQKNAKLHNGLHLVEETTTVQRCKVYAPRGK